MTTTNDLPRPEEFPLRPEYLGSAAMMTSFVDKDSGSRLQMASTQMNQSCVLPDSDIPRILHGFEGQLKDCTFGTRVPEDCTVVAIIPKFAPGASNEHVPAGLNPLETVIYQSDVTGEFGVFHLTKYQSQIERVHETFTYPFILTSRGAQLRENMTLYKGEMLTQSPNVKGHLWASGLNLNVAYYSSHPTIEDGFEIADDVIERASPKAYGTRVAQFGRRYFPRNLYGDENNYKPFPDIGDKIREDGLVVSLVEYNDLFDMINLTAKELMTPDTINDMTYYGQPGAVVTDITVDTTTNEGRRTPATPTGMERQAHRYHRQIEHYYDRIIEEYNKIERASRGQCAISGELNTLIARAYAERPNTNAARMEERKPRSETIHKTWRAEAIDEWRVEIFYVYTKKNGLGGKFSNLHGGKGVACHVRPRAEMPVTEDGRPVDIIVYAKGAVARLNPGQFYEHYINAASHYITKDMREMMDKGDYDRAWNHFMSYLDIVAPNMHANALKLDPRGREATMESIYDKGIYLQITAGNSYMSVETMQRLRAFRRPDKTRLIYTNMVGRKEMSRVPVLVGEMQYMVLDKLDHKPMAISGVLRQHHGLPATQNKSTKYLRPSKETPTRVLGEAETRSGCAKMGGEAVAELRDLSANPEAHRISIERLYKADNPCQVESVFDRNPNGPNKMAGRSLQFVRHVDECGGRAVVDVPPQCGWGEDLELPDGTVLHLRDNVWDEGGSDA